MVRMHSLIPRAARRRPRRIRTQRQLRAPRNQARTRPRAVRHQIHVPRNEENSQIVYTSQTHISELISVANIPCLRFWRGRELVFMMCSGSHDNIIKIGALMPQDEVNPQYRTNISSIDDQPIATLGTVQMKLFQNFVELHVVEDSAALPHDGIFGVELLKSMDSTINFETKTIRMNNIEMDFKSGSVSSNRIINAGIPENNPYLYMGILNVQLRTEGQFLIDTGSEVNVIKVGFVSTETKIDSQRSICIKGMGENRFNSLGSIRMPFCNTSAEFHVVSDDFPTPAEGVMGAALLTDLKAIIDFKSGRMITVDQIYELSERISHSISFIPTDIALNLDDV